MRNAVQGEILGQFEKPKTGQNAEKSSSKESDTQDGDSAFQFSDGLHQQTSEA